MDNRLLQVFRHVLQSCGAETEQPSYIKLSSIGVLPVRSCSGRVDCDPRLHWSTPAATDVSDRLGAKKVRHHLQLTHWLDRESTHNQPLFCKLTLLREDGQERVEVEALTVPSIPIKKNHQVKCEY